MAPVIELDGNPSTGYDWSWDVLSDGDVVAVNSIYTVGQPLRENERMLPGMGGRYCITLTGLTSGTATITFAYRRPWEEKEALYTLVYRVSVDEALNVTILGSSFDW